MALYRNDGEMNFVDSSYASGIAPATSPYVGWGDGFFDFDNDGWLDFFMVNGHVYPQVDIIDIRSKYREPKLLFLNQHNGTFRNISNLVGPAVQIPQVSRGTAFGDLFNDGHIEVVVENLKGQPMILRPEGGPANHWVSFELQGTKSNRLALNARVEIKTGNCKQLGEVLSGGSYLSQNDLRVHFGLGGARNIDSVEIRWPSRTVDTLKNLQADRFYRVIEGQGIVPVESDAVKSATK
jgi:hypothetical protein